MPQVQTNLVRPAGEGTDFQQRRAVGVSADHAEFRAGGKAVCRIDLAGPCHDRLVTNRGIAEKSVFNRISNHARQVGFLDFAALELGLNELGKMPGAGENNQATRVRIQPMGRAWLLRMVNRLQDRLECVAVESTARVNGQRGRLVDDDHRLVLVEDSNIGIHLRFHISRFFSIKSFSRLRDAGWLDGMEGGIEKAGIFKSPDPILARNMAEDACYRFKDGGSGVVRRNLNRAEVVARRAAG